MNAPNVPQYLTVAKIAKRVKRSAYTLRTHIRVGHLKAYKVEGAKGWRVKLHDAQAWASKHLGVRIS